LSSSQPPRPGLFEEAASFLAGARPWSMDSLQRFVGNLKAATGFLFGA
jgi:hypothetical protein